MRMSKILLPLVWFAMVSTVALAAATYEPANITPPKPPREFRGVWVTTLRNIDWPSKPGLSTAEQKNELLAILDRAARLKLNAIIFQVRPMCDALYASPIEPWSQCLTGTMGKPPQPFYDPLAFAIAEAHKRGLELHAWFNPYRALIKSPNSQPSASHVSKSRPELVRDYGKYLWLDPGERDVRDYVLRVVLDVVKRYDVDGVHFDDYFYPDPGPPGANADFPDEASWKRFGASGQLSRADWRRENVNALIERTYDSIKAAKPWVKFGVSPAGIWRPGHPPQIQGRDAYAVIYADSRKWLANGWLDYFAPQLYWPIAQPAQSFPVLLKWWAEQNKLGRHLWAGLNTVKTAGDKATWPTEEILKQIKITRQQAGVSGHIHWNLHGLLQNQLLVGNLTKDLYAEPALIPTTPWLGSVAPPKPDLSAAGNGGSGVKITWTPASGERVWLWLLQVRKGEKWSSQILPGDARSHVFSGSAPDAIALSAVGRLGNASSPATLAARK